jgi:integrase
MPRGKPSYRLHRASGQAIVTIRGRDIYLGRHGSPESHQKYSELMREHLDGRPVVVPGSSGLTVAEAALVYMDHAERYYRDQDGVSTRQMPRIQRAISTLLSLSASVPLAELGPKHLRECQRVWISEGLSRRYCNHLLVVTKTACKWLAREGLLPASRWVEIQLVEGLKLGRTSARESPETRPVPEADLSATLPYCSALVRDMISVQLLTGCRSGELVSMSWDDILTAPDGWVCRPMKHKNTWRGHARVIHIGPQAQTILMRHRRTSGLVFPLPSGRPYTVSVYSKHILRACRRAGVADWRPGQLRHNAATAIQGALGWDAARAVLGHRTVSTTRIYADRDAEAAAEAARRLG